MGLFGTRKDDVVLVELTNHQPDLSAFVRALLPGDPGADDVVQQTNLVVWRKRGSFRPSSDFRAWLFAIARLEVLAHRKRASRRAWLVIDEELTLRLAESMEIATRETSAGSLRHALDGCLQALRPAEQSVIERFYFSGESLRSMAEADARSEGALKVSLHRIRAALRRCIESRTRPSLGGLS
jgi:RNA polymerase sigma-70 factor (ECF subfamily)